ncbi:MAG: hypothetical protein RLZZ171_1407 [Cyanobacteriota bacterium]|jgi:hypothetical protein
MTTKIFELVDRISSTIKLPFQVRPISAEALKIPWSWVETGGLKLKSFSKLTAIESGILSSFRLELITQVTEQKRRMAELFAEMSKLLGVDNLDELQELMADADRLLELAKNQGVVAEQVSEWVDRLISTQQDFNVDATKLLLELNVITFMVAMRGEDPDWDYSDTYNNLTSSEMEEIMAFIYSEEGVKDPEEAIELKK